MHHQTLDQHTLDQPATSRRPPVSPRPGGWSCLGGWIKTIGGRSLGVGLTGGALILGASAQAQGEPPGIYYSWRATTTDVTQCIDRAGQALASQDLTPVQTDTVSIAGQSEATTAVFVCLETPGDSEATTVMVIVAGANDDQAVALREALKRAF